MTEFQSEGEFTLQGKRHFNVTNPSECSDFKHLLHTDVLIDGVQYHVVGVGHYALLPPFRAGVPISLMTTALPASPTQR
jgi:hypothetical protein